MVLKRTLSAPGGMGRVFNRAPVQKVEWWSALLQRCFLGRQDTDNARLTCNVGVVRYVYDHRRTCKALHAV